MCAFFPVCVYVFGRVVVCSQNLKSETPRDGGQKGKELGTDDNHWSERRRLVEDWEDYDEVGVGLFCNVPRCRVERFSHRDREKEKPACACSRPGKERRRNAEAGEAGGSGGIKYPEQRSYKSSERTYASRRGMLGENAIMGLVFGRLQEDLVCVYGMVVRT